VNSIRHLPKRPDKPGVLHGSMTDCVRFAIVGAPITARD